jgi:hypothetical protein
MVIGDAFARVSVTVGALYASVGDKESDSKPHPRALNGHQHGAA